MCFTTAQKLTCFLPKVKKFKMLTVFQRFLKKLVDRIIKRKTVNFKNFGKLEFFTRDLDGREDNSGL